MKDKINEIEIKNLRRFEGNPFEIREDEAFIELQKSIGENGIIVPIIVIPTEKENEFEIISGNRRVEAARRIGLETIPADIQNLSRDEAVITLVDCNISQRDLLPSEKAFGYKLKHDALKHQGKSDVHLQITSGQKVPKSDSRRSASIIGEENGDSYKTVQRLIRLTYLNPDLLKLVDEGRMAMGPAVEISYLPKEYQELILSVYDEEKITPSYSQSVEMKKLFSDGDLKEEKVRDILSREKPNQKEMIKLPAEKFSKFFKSTASPKQTEDFILKACEYYARYLQRQRERNER